MLGWPEHLMLVRHGESVGNVANAKAYADGAERLDLDLADPLVPLTEQGVRQATALGERLAAEMPAPQQCLASPYLRTEQTARHLLAAAGWEDVPLHLDERLRDREQGVLDRLTVHGIRRHFPDEAARRAGLGKFYYRPPGGESWADVVLRVRAVINDLRDDFDGRSVLLVTHDVPILAFRYALEGLSSDEAVALSGQVVNCGITAYERRADHLVLHRWNDQTPIAEDDEARVTEHGERP